MDVIAHGSRPRSRRPPQHRAGRRGRYLARLVELAVVVAVLVVCWPHSLGGTFSFVEVSGHSMLPTYSSGDLLVTRSRAVYRAGDIVVYSIPDGDVGAGRHIVHRIIGGNGNTGFQTRGDNNPYPDPWHPRTGEIVGRAVVHVPGGGTWLEFLARPVNLGIFCGSITVTCMLWPRSARSRSNRRRRAGVRRRSLAGMRTAFTRRAPGELPDADVVDRFVREPEAVSRRKEMR